MDLHLGFFKGQSSESNKKYSNDPVGDHVENNHLNVRVAYKKSGHELGVSAESGQLYNKVVNEQGSYSAAGAHYMLQKGNFNFQLVANQYEYKQKVATGADDTVITMGSFGSDFKVAAKAKTYTVNLAYDIKMDRDLLKKVKPYVNYSVLDKDEDGFNNSWINTIGAEWSFGPIFIYSEWIQSSNGLFLGTDTDPLAKGNEEEKIDHKYVIEMGLYF